MSFDEYSVAEKIRKFFRNFPESPKWTIGSAVSIFWSCKLEIEYILAVFGDFEAILAF